MRRNTAEIQAADRDMTAAEDDLRLTLGPNGESYLALWRRSRGSRLGLYGGWSWWGFLTPLPWLLYRKLWAVGAALALLPFLCQAVLGTGAKAGFLLAALVGGLGKPMVLERALRKVRQTEALGLAPGDAVERLRRAGGVSLAGGLFGVMLSLSYFALVFGHTRPVALPACDDPAVTSTAIAIARDSAAGLGLDAGDLTLAEIAEDPSPRHADRLCVGALHSGTRRLAVEFLVAWQDRESRTISVDLRLRAP